MDMFIERFAGHPHAVSMGSSGTLSPNNCSRLTYGIGFINAVIQCQLQPFDCYTVIAFDGQVHVITDREEKGHMFNAGSCRWPAAVM